MKTVRVACQTANEIRQAFREKGHVIGSVANDLLDLIGFPSDAEFDLVSVQVRELCNGPAELQEIFAKAEEHGLGKCPAIAAVQYLLDCANNLIGSFVVAMRTVIGPNGREELLVITTEGTTLKLDSDCGLPDEVYPADARFIFIRPRRR
jgi:hypothetical protein